jgi:hypothetical protein
MARIVVSGYMIRYPMAGAVLAYLHYVVGLARLGHEVLYFEESGWPDACFDPQSGHDTGDPTPGLVATRAALAATGVRVPVCYLDRATGASHGLGRRDLLAALPQADLWLDLGGVCWQPMLRRIRHRALVDMDPLFTQIGRFAADSLAEHHTCFSYGTNVGRPECLIPTGEQTWHPTVPPVVLDLWPYGHDPGAMAAFTTVASWSAYGALEYNGERYGQKDVEFERVLELPGLTSAPLELALAGAGRSVETRLREAGWRLRDANEVSATLEAYQGYVAGSLGEFSVAKEAYVKSRSGWFSDRSVCYLAAGRPVVVQDTGLGRWLRTGCGVLTFSTVDQAAAALETVRRDHARHSSAARSVARHVFAHDVVLPPLIERALAHEPHIAVPALPWARCTLASPGVEGNPQTRSNRTTRSFCKRQA